DSNGRGTSRTTYLEAGFASDEDRAAWDTAGSPSLPEAGDVVTDTLKPGNTLFFDLSSLSTDPETLLAQLRSGVPVERPPGDENTFVLIGDALAFGRTSADQRRALYTVAGELDGVTLVGDVVDPLGRPGVGLAVAGTTETTMLVFDQDTAQLLATETFASGADAAATTPTSWSAYQPVEMLKSSEAPRASGSVVR